MDKEKPLISVIVPVYNVEPYLDRCLASLEAQTWPNMEILVVDDASTDGGGAVCDAHRARDDRIQVIHMPENQGLSAARNEGVRRAKGKYVSFVDSDDYVEPELLERLYDCLAKSGAEISICAADGLADGDMPACILSRQELVRCLAGRSPFLWTAWGKLYPADVVRAHPFDRRAVCCEDLLFFYEILENVERAGYAPERLYHYVYRDTSLINNGVDEKRCTVLSVLDFICGEVPGRFPETAAGFGQIALDTAVRLAMQAVEGGMKGRELSGYLKRFRDHVRRHFSLDALMLCPSKKSAAAQIMLYSGQTLFRAFAVLYKSIKERN